jgi:hypothetical protein
VEDDPPRPELESLGMGARADEKGTQARRYEKGEMKIADLSV